jgi:predicted acetyltransferase
MKLVRPTAAHLPSYIAALERGWSPDSSRPEAAQEELARIRLNAAQFLAGMEDREATGPVVTLPDGSVVPRLPGLRRWLWQEAAPGESLAEAAPGAFCGSIGLRWQKGPAGVSTDLPPHCLGHIGYSVVPWKRGQGLATAALAQLLPEARALGLPWVELTTDPDNTASQKVIQANGGVLVEHFTKPPQYGSTPGLRFRIALR